jgi:hypothetical protein
MFNTNIILRLDVKLSVIVSLDSPSCEVPYFDPELGGFIGTLPDRP